MQDKMNYNVNEQTKSDLEINEFVYERRMAGDTFVEIAQKAGIDLEELVEVLDGQLSHQEEDELIRVMKDIRLEDYRKRVYLEKLEILQTLKKKLLPAVLDADFSTCPPEKNTQLLLKVVEAIDKQDPPEMKVKMGWREY